MGWVDRLLSGEEDRGLKRKEERQRRLLGNTDNDICIDHFALVFDL